MLTQPRAQYLTNLRGYNILTFQCFPKSMIMTEHYFDSHYNNEATFVERLGTLCGVSDSQSRNSCIEFQPLGTFIHYKMIPFTQLYERIYVRQLRHSQHLYMNSHREVA